MEIGRKGKELIVRSIDVCVYTSRSLFSSSRLPFPPVARFYASVPGGLSKRRGNTRCTRCARCAQQRRRLRLTPSQLELPARLSTLKGPKIANNSRSRGNGTAHTTTTTTVRARYLDGASRRDAPLRIVSLGEKRAEKQRSRCVSR